MILGFDLSTSCTGYTILNEDGDVVINSSWQLSKLDSFYDKILFVKKELFIIKEKYKIENIFIEQSLNKFKDKFSSAEVLALLAKFNGVVSWLCYEIFDLKPSYISASTARKKCGITIKKGIEQKAKEQVYEHLKNEKWFKPEFKKTGRLKDFCYDRLDSFVIAKAGFLQNVDREKT